MFYLKPITVFFKGLFGSLDSKGGEGFEKMEGLRGGKLKDFGWKGLRGATGKTTRTISWEKGQKYNDITC